MKTHFNFLNKDLKTLTMLNVFQKFLSTKITFLKSKYLFNTGVKKH